MYISRHFPVERRLGLRTPALPVPSLIRSIPGLGYCAGVVLWSIAVAVLGGVEARDLISPEALSTNSNVKAVSVTNSRVK
jgi:hypothetical protein